MEDDGVARDGGTNGVSKSDEKELTVDEYSYMYNKPGSDMCSRTQFMAVSAPEHDIKLTRLEELEELPWLLVL